jgi:small GTP-binding protein
MEKIFSPFKLSDNYQVGCYFYDINGTQKFRLASEIFYKKVDGCIIVYDITNQKSFDEIENYFIPTIKKNCIKNIPTLLLGNKSDLKDLRIISVNQGMQLALKYNFIFRETSSIENININDIFKTIIEKTYYDCKDREQNDNNSITLNHNHNLNFKRYKSDCCN